MAANEFVNADQGGHAVLADAEKRHWWNWYLFPLVPQLETRPADDYNAGSFYFSWLLLRAWSMDRLINFAIEFQVSDSGICFAASLPYLRLWLWLLPLPPNGLAWIGHRWGKLGKPW